MENKKLESLISKFKSDLTKERIAEIYHLLQSGQCVTLISMPEYDTALSCNFSLQRTEFTLKSEHGEEHYKKIIQYFFYSPFHNGEKGDSRWDSMYIVEKNENEYDEFYEWFTDEVAYDDDLWQTGYHTEILVFGYHELANGEIGELFEYLEETITAE